MATKTSHRRIARQTTRKALAEVTCRPFPADQGDLLDLETRIAKATSR